MCTPKDKLQDLAAPVVLLLVLWHLAQHFNGGMAKCNWLSTGFVQNGAARLDVWLRLVRPVLAEEGYGAAASCVACREP